MLFSPTSPDATTQHRHVPVRGSNAARFSVLPVLSEGLLHLDPPVCDSPEQQGVTHSLVMVDEAHFPLWQRQLFP